jgi:hypothetical protein
MISRNRDPLHTFLRSLSSRRGIIPPFALELVLVDGMYYYVHSVDEASDDSVSISIRIWDTRHIDERDMEELRLRVAGLEDQSMLADPRSLHRDLDWGILRIDIDQISYCVEWHHKLWPVDAESTGRTRLH